MRTSPGLIGLVLTAVLIAQPAGTQQTLPQGPVAPLDRQEALKKDHLRLSRERRSREFLRGIREQLKKVDPAYLRAQYGIQLDPALAKTSDAELSSMILAVQGEMRALGIIYDGEKLKDIYLQPPSDPDLSRAAVLDRAVLDVSRSVVAIVYRDSLTRNGQEWTLRVHEVSELMTGSEGVCEFDRYRKAPAASIAGTGFLVGDSLIATAGHVVQVPHQDFLASVYFLFGYVLESEGVAKTIYRDDDVYEGAKVLVHCRDTDSDWALIRLNRKVTGGRVPLTCRDQGRISPGERLYMLGHPYGMPLKYSGPAQVLQEKSCHQYCANLDTRTFNSGSPVINLDGHFVEGILDTDLRPYQKFCGCEAPVPDSSQRRDLGALVTSSLEVSEYLARPESFIIECRVSAARVSTASLDTFLTEGQRFELPYDSLGATLFADVDCDLTYPVRPGQTWIIDKTLPDTSVFMTRQCPR